MEQSSRHGNGKARRAARPPRFWRSKRASATKSGPGRYATHGEPGHRLTKQKPLRAFRALMRHFAGMRVSKAGNKRGMGLL
jgi:hypothetical protein